MSTANLVIVCSTVLVLSIVVALALLVRGAPMATIGLKVTPGVLAGLPPGATVAIHTTSGQMIRGLVVAIEGDTIRLVDAKLEGKVGVGGVFRMSADNIEAVQELQAAAPELAVVPAVVDERDSA